jgi:hypothetical protein
LPLNPADGDRLIARLVETRDRLSPAESEAFLARLVLLLANEVGDQGVVLEAATAAAPEDEA